jgi:phage tail-like protein
MATVKPSIGHIATDPLRNFKFKVRISLTNDGGLNSSFLNMGFMSVTGLNVTTEVIPYREGGLNTTTQKMPGQSDFAPITLSRGVVVGSSAQMDWMSRLFTVMQGTGTGAAGQEFRGTVDILVMDHPVTNSINVPTKAAFRVYNAWPTSIAFSDLDAGANAVFLQQMSLAHEGFNFKLAKTIGTESVSF